MRPRFGWATLVGIDRNFSRGDKFVSSGMVFWGLFCSGLVAALSVWNAVSPLPLAFWSRFWKIAGIGIPACIALVTAVWFTWGGLRNLRDLFARLRVQKINHLDDGTVVGHRNLDEAAPSETASEKK